MPPRLAGLRLQPRQRLLDRPQLRSASTGVCVASLQRGDYCDQVPLGDVAEDAQGRYGDCGVAGARGLVDLAEPF